MPTAYALARLQSRAVNLLITLLLISSFVTVTIKVLALTVVLGDVGILNDFMRHLGVIDEPFHFLNNRVGVVIGLVQYTLPLMIMIIYGVIRAIPVSYEEAAEIHGSTRLNVFVRVLIPIAKPGILSATMMSFNMSIGAFSTTVLLGGGKVLTLPVLIYGKITQDVDYPFGAALSTFLLGITFLINLGAANLFNRGPKPSERLK